jgi:hypothetical protein
MRGPAPRRTPAPLVWAALRGWIRAGSAQLVSGSLHIGSTPRPPGRFTVRGFGQTGGTVFDARDSFDTLVGSTFGLMSGGGGQVVFPNGAYAQVGFDRFRKTGSRVLVSGNQLFMLDSPTQLTVTPILGTVGYRAPGYSRFAPYVGVGLGWHSLARGVPRPRGDRPDRREQARLPRRRRHRVPHRALPRHRRRGSVRIGAKALGQTGLLAVYGEENLGGGTFRSKVIVGY